MNKSIKKILITGASLLMLASVGVGINGIKTNAHAAYRIEDQYYSKFNRLIPGMKRGSVVNHNFYKHGYLFNVYTTGEQERHGAMGDLDPVVVGIDGDKNVSNSQIWAALRGHRVHLHRNHRHYRRRAVRHYRRRANKRHTRHHARRYGRRSHHRY